MPRATGAATFTAGTVVRCVPTVASCGGHAGGQRDRFQRHAGSELTADVTTAAPIGAGAPPLPVVGREVAGRERGGVVAALLLPGTQVASPPTTPAFAAATALEGAEAERGGDAAGVGCAAAVGEVVEVRLGRERRVGEGV